MIQRTSSRFSGGVKKWPAIEVLAVALGGLVFCPVLADTVWITGNPVPIHGRIAQISADTIVLEPVGGVGRSETIPGTSVQAWHRSIDPLRLESLGPNAPEDYLQYAEELAGIRFDPASLALSRQLALFALHLDRDRGVGSASAISGRALALLLALEGDESRRQRLNRLGIARGLLNSPAAPEATPEIAGQTDSVPDPAASRILLEQIRQIRRGEFPSDNMEQQIEQWQHSLRDWGLLMTVPELQECVSAGTLSAAQKLRLVRLEIAIADFLETGRLVVDESDKSNWALTSRLPAIRVPGSITTRNVLEFDPEQCLWRGGQWIAPGQ